MKLNRRSQFLIGFGALAVVLLVAFNMWYPPVSDEAATGAVGAVKKHRQQQISQQDVLLGDEASRKQEKIVYADYLADAAALENMSADLAMALRNKGAESLDLGSMQATLAAASRSLEAQSSDIEARAFVAAQSALESMNAILAAASLDLAMKSSMEADLRNVALTLENRSKLASADMDAVSVQLANVADKIENRVLRAASADAMLAQLESAQLTLENKQADQVTLENMTLDLAAVSRLVGMNAVLENAALEQHEAYLAAMARQNRMLESAQLTLESVSRNLAAASALASADALTLEQTSRQLASHSAVLENLAVASLESRMQLVTLENKSLASLDEALGAVSLAFANRSAQLSAQARQDLELGLKTADLALANRQSGLETAMLASMNLELAAVGRHLDNRAQLNNRWAEAGTLGPAMFGLDAITAYLGKMSTQVENRKALESKSALEQRSALENKQALENMQLEQELANKARQLENRAKQL